MTQVRKALRGRAVGENEFQEILKNAGIILSNADTHGIFPKRYHITEYSECYYLKRAGILLSDADTVHLWLF